MIGPRLFALILFIIGVAVALAAWLGAPIPNGEYLVLAFIGGGLAVTQIG